jgi:hypothetical protein
LALEVRALGCLLQELGTAVQAPAAHPAVQALQALQALARDCLSAQPSLRPSAIEVAQALQSLRSGRDATGWVGPGL